MLASGSLHSFQFQILKVFNQGNTVFGNNQNLVNGSEDLPISLLALPSVT